MPIDIGTSQQVAAVVTNSRQGVVELNVEMEGSKLFKSINLAKYPDGTRLILTFRITGKGQRQLVRHEELKPSDRFRLVIVDYDELALSSFEDVTDWLSHSIKLDPDSLNDILELMQAGRFPVNVKVGLQFSEAFSLKETLTEKSSGVLIFDVIKHTKEDMPEDLDSVVDLSMLEYIGDYYIQESLRPLFMVAGNVAQRGDHFNVLLLGPSGYGKTSAAEMLAQYLEYDFIRVDCSLILDTESWFGRHRAIDGSTHFIPSEFTEAVRRGNTVVLLDEANRIEPWLSNSLFPLLDHARQTWVQGEHIKAGPGTIFAFTMNIGIKYAGTHVVDAAWLNRMDAVVEVGPLPRQKEEEMLFRTYPHFDAADIRKIVGLVDELRRVANSQKIDVDVSTRTSHKLVHLMDLGLSLRQAAVYIIETPCPVDDRKPIIDVLNSRLGV